MLEKIKGFTGKIGKKGKAMLCTSIAAVSMLAMTAAASAAEADTTTTTTNAFDFSNAMETAGQSIQNQLGALVLTLIPCMIGVVSVGLAIFGVVQLVKLMKKIFGQVTG